MKEKCILFVFSLYQKQIHMHTYIIRLIFYCILLVRMAYTGTLNAKFQFLTYKINGCYSSCLLSKPSQMQHAITISVYFSIPVMLVNEATVLIHETIQGTLLQCVFSVNMYRFCRRSALKEMISHSD